MSHEVRTPVAAILGFSELITAPDLNQEDRSSFTKAIRRNGELLTNIINDILDISKVEAGQLSVDFHETSVMENLNDILEILKVRASEKNIELIVQCSDTVPKTIITDPLRLRQILLNIIGNAIKFTEKGEVRLKIDMYHSSTHAPELLFEVSDTGIGISPRESVKLFRPFSQADLSTTRRFGGAGLGLALSKGLANLLGGDVSLVSSVKDEGSTFIVKIDPGPVHLIKDIPVESSQQASVDTDLKLDGLKVLIVEDSPDNRIIISRFLGKQGAMVETCEDGLSGVQEAMTGKYDVVLMDIQMPIMDGYEAVTELRKLGYGKPVIALTAHALREERQHCLDIGFDEHISKPVDRNVLADLIVRLCR
ncbi:MAG: response regulator [Proteobacteria bacterium]|nr:MAG: response regulator [Pseudomonadota bacterium]